MMPFCEVLLRTSAPSNPFADTSSMRRPRCPVTKVTLDYAGYDPNLREGEVLVRSGAKLVPSKSPSYSYR